MINIAVCDDNLQFANLLLHHLKKLSVYKIPQRVDCRFAPAFFCADDVLEYLKENTIDILFLDIDMPKANGFELAKILCDSYPDIVIVFVSSYEEFVYSSFEYCPFRFLRKSHLTEELDVTFRKVIEKCVLNNKALLFSTTDGDIVLRIKDIILFEGQKNYYLIKTVSEAEYKCRGTMSSVDDRVKNFDFFRIHSAYIVNLEHIEAINSDGYIITKKGQRVSLSKKRASRFKDAYMQYIRRRISK